MKSEKGTRGVLLFLEWRKKKLLCFGGCHY
uniref:Uncharacterized protein n=1 Tax=Anguilla anguilla TaxID=7936 RepID=A0A0E9QDH2_ANGAN